MSKVVRADGQHRKYGRKWTLIREIILLRDNCTCEYCGDSIYNTPNLVLEVDHIVPFARGGGEYDLDNCVTSCFSCNRTFGAKRKPREIERSAKRNAAARNRAEGL